MVATKVPDWGEFVLAELTQPFDQPDVSYFFPLMAATEQRLGFRPPYAAFDAAFDAFYVYEYFISHHAGTRCRGFAAVPFSERGGHKRASTPTACRSARPTCPCRCATPFQQDDPRRARARPLRLSAALARANRRSLPRRPQTWAKGGCTATMPTSIGARLRYQLDRDSQAYKDVYKQRTATERINSQAVELGIERPKCATAGHRPPEHLIYILINLRALQRKLGVQCGCEAKRQTKVARGVGVDGDDVLATLQHKRARAGRSAWSCRRRVCR